jgi:4a-hydroxytetrahydrobiopterin dehydratase
VKPRPVDLPGRCVPCEGGVAALDEAAARLRLSHVPSWSLQAGRLRRAFQPRDFRAALAWITRVGDLAEEQGHHPDVHLTRWNHVELELWTHAAGGLTDNDFVLAREIDALWEREGG